MNSFNNSWVPVAIYIMLIGVISLIAIFSVRETKNLDFERGNSETGASKIITG
jgi:hypothetical protein